MKLTNHEWLRADRWIGLLWMAMGLMGMGSGSGAHAQAVSTTTVQGTVYLANGQPGSGTLVVSWPSFTTASGQLVTADSTTVTIAPDGFVSVNLAPTQGATPAGQYYTAVYYLSDGTTNTEYWVVPTGAQATLGQVQAQLMPAAQAVQAVSKTYVDQTIAGLTGSFLAASGGTLSGPLTLCCDPTQPMQAADKHYVDESFALALPLAGGSMTGALATPTVNGVESPLAGSSQTTLQAAMGAAGTNGAMEIPPTYAGTDGFTNPNGVYVMDLRQGNSQQYERSVKEFGAVCDGSTDDTNALQSALNYAQTHGVALTIPQGTCKTRTLIWHGESIGGMGKQVSALMGFPGLDVLLAMTDSVNLLAYTRIHDLTIYVDQSLDASCSAAKGAVPAGSCAANRPMESNSIFSPGGNGLTGTAGTGSAWAVGNCAIAMPATTGVGGNGLKVAEIENLEIAATGVDPMAAQYPGAHSTHTCGLYLAQWPQWSEFRNIDIRGLNTGIAIPALPVTAPAGLNSDSNRWQNITIQATHGFTAAAGSNNVLDNVVVMAGNSAATGEPPTGLVLDLAGTQQGWTLRNSVVLPVWNAVQPALNVTASGGAVTAVTVGSQAGLGFDPYGTQVPLAFSGSCTAQATASVTSSGAIGAVTVTSGGVGCSGTTTASVNVAGTWDTYAPVNLVGGQNMTFYGGNLLKGNGGYTVWNAAGSESYGTQLDGGGGNLPGGGTYAALVANNSLGHANEVDQFPGADFGAKLQACLGALNSSYGGTCDARNFTGTLSMGSNLTITTPNATVQLPCATISTANQVIVTAGTRNVSLRGCALRGASTVSGSQGGTVFLYSGTGAMVQVGDPTYTADTPGFHMDNAVINTTATSSSTAQGLTAYRTQEMDLESLYFLGNSNQTGMTLDGTGNYTGGTFLDNEFNGFQTAVNAIGHQVTNSAATDWMNASTFVRLHIDCPTSGGSPISGTYGINLQQGDGNTFTGGDVEGCSTAMHLGANAQNNTIVGLRNENSTNQVVADAGSSYNNWMTGGTIFTGQLTDNGTRNSFLDTFHRSFNGLNGDWYGSQKDATVTNHYRLGTGAGNERGLLDRYQTDYGYRWTTGLSDATAGEQFYQILDELNNVYRISVGQYNNGQSSTNNQTVVNAAGTGAVVLNGSTNAGTGGVVIGSGGSSETTVATISNAGNAQFNGTLQVGGVSSFTGSTTVKNQMDAEIDATLWAGLTTSQKESFIYKDWNGNSQWYMVKDASNNWALNSATGGLDSFKAYQSTNSGDTYVNASNPSGVVRVNYESGSGAGFKVYGGNSSTLYASFTGANAIKFPGLAANSGYNCLQIDNSGNVTPTGATCGTGNTNGTVNAGTAAALAYYPGNGTALSPLSPAQAWSNLFATAGVNPSCALLTTNGSGSLACSSYTSSGALAALGAEPVLPGVTSDSNNGVAVVGNVASGITNGWQRNVCSYSTATYPTHGDKVRACNADAIAAGGGVCDSRCIEGTTNQTTGTLPIEIGSPTAKVTWLLPSSGSLGITQNGNTLPTPAAPTVTTSTASGTLPAGTYYVKITYKSGGGHSAASAEASAVLSAQGSITVSSPASTAYSYSYDVYASTSSGTETWQENCKNGVSCTIGVHYPGTLLSGYESAPSSANGVPAIIIHAGSSSGMISDASASGYLLAPSSSMNVSNVIATEDGGEVVLKNISVGTFIPAGTYTDSMILLQAIFSQANVDGIWSYCGTGGPDMKIRDSDDLEWGHITLSGNNQANCSPIVSLDSRPVFGFTSDHIGDITFTGLNLLAPANGATMFQVIGNGDGMAMGAGASGILILNPTFENAYNTSNVTFMSVSDTMNFTVLNPKFQYGTGTGNVGLKLSEDNPCMTRTIWIQNADLMATAGSVFVNDTITPEIVTPPAGGWNGGYASYQFGTSPTDNCQQSTVNYVRGYQQNTDIASQASFASAAANPSLISGANLVLNPGFEGGNSSGTGASWTSSCNGGGTCTFAIDSTIYHSGTQSQSATLSTTTGQLLLASSPFSVIQGNTYQFSFWARNDGTSSLGLSAQVSNASGSMLYCGVQNATLSATWKYVSVPCTALATGSAAEVQFFTAATGSTAGEVWIDDVFFAGTSPATNPGFGTAAQLSNTAAVWNANQVNGANVPTSATVVGTNSSGQLITSLVAGTVTSVTFTGDGTVLSSTPSTAVTSSGTVTATLANAAQNSVLAGPATGGAGAPSYQTAPAISVTNMTGTGAFNITGSAGSATMAANLAGGSMGSLHYQSGPGTTAMLAGNTSTTKCFVQETGTGSGALAPSCSALQAADIPNNAANTSGNAATATTATNLAGGSAGSIHYQSAASTTAMLAGNTAATDQVLVSHGTGSAAAAPILTNAPALSATNMTNFPAISQTITGTSGGLTPGAHLTLSAAATDIVNLTGGPTITQGGTAGSSTYVYGVVARNTTGTVYSAISPFTTTSTGAATLNSTNYNLVTFPSLPTNANCFDVYRIIALGSPTSQGLIASCQTTSYNDQGAAGNSAIPPYYASWMPQTSGLPAGCLHYPCVVAAGVISGLPVATSTTGGYVLTYTTPSGLTGVYQLCGQVTMTSVGTAGTIYPAGVVLWLGHTHYPTLASGATAATANSDSSLDANGNVAGCKEFSADAASNIQFDVTFSGVTGNPVYTTQYSLTRLK
jgi:hypothetical protein